MLARRTPLRRKTPLKRSTKRIARVRPERAKELREYRKLADKYLAENPICEVWLKENGWEKIPGVYGVWYRNIKAHIHGLMPSQLIALGAPRSTEVHHMNKRRRKRLLDVCFFLAVSGENHRRIEADKKWAREKGFLLNF